MGEIEAMKEMIRREIQSIEDLEERRLFKELMENVFIALYETNMEMYEHLEKRVFEEVSYDINRYRIITGLAELTGLDQSHHLLTAVCEEDLHQKSYHAGEIRKQLDQHGSMCLTSFFLQCDSMEVNRFFDNHKEFAGVLYAGKPYPVTVKVEPSRRYLKQMEHLYHLFMKNGIPWSSLNAPYLFKMADVSITELPEEIPDDEPVSELQTDFGKYNSFIHYDMVPVWNVQRLQLRSIGFPIACRDHRNYEHVIPLQKYVTHHTYLVEERQGIHKVRQVENKLIITGEIAEAKKWNVYMVRNGAGHKFDRYRYPLMSNLRKDGFAERFHQRAGQPVRTKAELERFVRGYHLEDFVEYQDCTLMESDEMVVETYAANFFIRDEIRESKGKKQLILYFKSLGKEPWLLRDLMSFICSEVQELYPEYLCGGVLR